MEILDALNQLVSSVVPIVKDITKQIVSNPMACVEAARTKLIHIYTEKAHNSLFTKKIDVKSASVEEIKSVNEELTEYSRRISKEVFVLEKQILEFVEQHFNKFFKELAEEVEKNKIIDRLPTECIRQQRDTISSKIRQGTKRLINEKISLDNIELLNILELNQSKQKDVLLEKFRKRIMKESLNQTLLEVEKVSKVQKELLNNLFEIPIEKLTFLLGEKTTALSKLYQARQEGKEQLNQKKQYIEKAIDAHKLALAELESL
ncbi:MULTISPECIES: hypothetical protein [unclassified Bacillus cereus group]|uniref:hypothetical protein n=1 Tax=unclassified Bacillus cereus group TaxID=2750818 RepID=UPI000943DB90|nr:MULTISPECIES: hypothetical protein [unclassified Bacillus cereus group]MDA2144897.1 hypothetical protein [Bacillus cereus group sp. Bc248]MDA2172912.1 hypothetical protein [Bacillus cereus group sp. Bc247]